MCCTGRLARMFSSQYQSIPKRAPEHPPQRSPCRWAPHLGSSRRRLLLWRSTHARSWEKVTESRALRWEYRDPKFCQIGVRLFIYALPNVSRMAEPVKTVCTSSLDGVTWSPITDIA